MADHLEVKRIRTEHQKAALALRREQQLTYREIGQHFGVSGSRARQWVAEALQAPEPDPHYAGLSRRSENVLRRARLTLADAQRMSDDDLLGVRNLGLDTLLEIRATEGGAR